MASILNKTPLLLSQVNRVAASLLPGKSNYRSQNRSQTQTDTQTSLFNKNRTCTISGKHEFLRNTNNTIMLIYKFFFIHVGRPPIRSYLTVGMEATYSMCSNGGFAIQCHVNSATNNRWAAQYKRNENHKGRKEGRKEGKVDVLVSDFSKAFDTRLFHAPTRTTSSGCFMLHRTVHALWNLYGNPYRNRVETEEETIP